MTWSTVFGLLNRSPVPIKHSVMVIFRTRRVFAVTPLPTLKEERRFDSCGEGGDGTFHVMPVMYRLLYDLFPV